MDDRGFILDSDAAAEDVYSTLSGDEVRTLLLAPGKRGTPIVCEMQVMPSPRGAQYEALSYVWGDATKSKSISCNGFDFPVTESLHTALVYLRYEDSWRRLWVDQLSINQDRNDELMAQVGLMGTIYSSAGRVIVWLGEFDRKMALAWELLQETTLSSSLVRSDFLHSSPGASSQQTRPSMSRQASSGSSASRLSGRASTSRESLSSSTSSLKSGLSPRPKGKRQNTPPAFRNVLSIFQHVWFSRKWTFQEIILAKAAIICCGGVEMAWSDLTLWYFHYASKLRSSSLLYDSHGSFENVMNVRNELGKGSLTLSSLLMLTRPRSSRKPEDAVYALLGLLPKLVDKLNPISNSLGSPGTGGGSQEAFLFNLYMTAFSYCLESENDLAILSAAGKYKGNVHTVDWPSWLPDWRQPLPLRPLVLADTTVLMSESAFDEEISNGASPDPLKAGIPVYEIKFSPSNASISSAVRPSMTLRGIRLGCIITRPLSWPSTFLVADIVTQPFLQNGQSDAEEPHFAQSLAALVPSRPLLQVRKDARLKGSRNYAIHLIQKSLKTDVQCEPVRTSAMVETGDWLCAFNGGRVLYALRPTNGSNHLDEVLHAGPGARRKRGMQGSGPRPLPKAHGYLDDTTKYIFVGECAVHGLSPVELLETIGERMEFDLV